MKQIINFFIVFIWLSSIALSQNTKPTEITAACAQKVEAKDYAFEIQTHNGKTYFCHEVSVIDKATALIVTYKTIKDDLGCRELRLETLIPLADIKTVKSIFQKKATSPTPKNMSLPAINFNLQDGALGQQLPEKNHVSALIVYCDTSNSSNKYGVYNSINDAIADGFTPANPNVWEVVAYHHIKNFFRKNKNATLYVRVFPTAAGSFSVIEWLQTQAEGQIRQFGIHAQAPVTDIPTDMELIQARLNALQANYTPAVAVVGWATTPAPDDLHDLTNGIDAHSVAAMIGGLYGDSSATEVGASYLKNTLLPSSAVTDCEIPAIGTALGTLSAAQLHENIGWVDKYNLLGGTNDNIPSISNSGPIAGHSLGDMDTWADKGYMFIRTFSGYAGAYISNDVTATLATSDYNSLRNNRVINECIRRMYVYYVPLINAPITLNTNGTLTESSRKLYESKGASALESRFTNGNISAYECYVNPSQNVLSTNKVTVNARIIPIGCSSFIDINLGFAPTLV